MNIKKKILLSFVGLNDAGTLVRAEEGTILTALSEEKFDGVILIWNENSNSDIPFVKIVSHLTEQIKSRNLAKTVQSYEINLTDVTDHNLIYSELLRLTERLDKSSSRFYTAAISSGTPSMQVCWILMAESGDFASENPLRLIRVREKRFGKPIINEVKLDTSLPKIIRLEEENNQLKKQLLPQIKINTTTGNVLIGDFEIPFSPNQYAYYRYFAKCVLEDKGYMRVSGFFVDRVFLETIHRYHEETFPDLDLMREPLKELIEKNGDYLVTNFRSNISKINKVIEKSLVDSGLCGHYKINQKGARGAKMYGLEIPAEKIIIN
ncbi:MAG: hypothetical protein SCALA702_26260 [Melioribacteraceae bacterium]|nr:MAG: hypothetical protein SCALA702_26260 [Melioribacteraceae bacterium]